MKGNWWLWQPASTPNFWGGAVLLSPFSFRTSSAPFRSALNAALHFTDHVENAGYLAIVLEILEETTCCTGIWDHRSEKRGGRENSETTDEESNASDDAEPRTDHLDDIEEGAGCTEIWDHLSEKWAENDASSDESATETEHSE